MTPLRQRFVDDLRIRNYADSTLESYSYHVACFARFHGRSPEGLGPEEVRAYQVHLVTVKKVSWTTFNQTVCALRFLYRVTLPRDWHVAMIPFGKKPRTLPTVLGGDEVQRLLACVHQPFYRTVLTTLYAAGLRLQEGLHLQLPDIDSARMLLRVTRGKGAKERLVPLSPRLLTELREHWQRTTPRPTTWLFPGKAGRPFSETNIQKACQRAAAEAQLHKRVTPHTLRHSYATGLLEAGVDLLTIQQLLGHRSFSTTLVYLHVRRPHLETVVSPLDLLPVTQCPRVMPPEPFPTPPIAAVAAGLPTVRR